MFTDAPWQEFGPAVDQAKRHRGGQKPKLPDRMFFEALLYIARTGIPWRDLPSDFGAWDAVDNRFRRWVCSGGLHRLRASVNGLVRQGRDRCLLPADGRSVATKILNRS